MLVIYLFTLLTIDVFYGRYNVNSLVYWRVDWKPCTTLPWAGAV